ncbi:hypothetical protein MJ588_03020 [Klebsiella pneumoniae]|nr:hypothetical protein MJ588_03020 [Klebsiella pneumoniae]
MTFAATPLLLTSRCPNRFNDWLTPLMSDRYDPHLAPGGAEARPADRHGDDGKARAVRRTQ